MDVGSVEKGVFSGSIRHGCWLNEWELHLPFALVHLFFEVGGGYSALGIPPMDESISSLYVISASVHRRLCMHT